MEGGSAQHAVDPISSTLASHAIVLVSRDLVWSVSTALSHEGRGMASRLPVCPGQAWTWLPSCPTTGPPRAPSFLLAKSASTLEGNMLESVPRVGPSCHTPSCWDPGVWCPVPACRRRPGRHTQLLTHQGQGGGPSEPAGATVSVFSPALPPVLPPAL